MPAVLGELRAAQAGDLLAADGDAAAGGLVHAAQQVQDGRLARAGGAEHHAELALLDRKADVVHGLHDVVAGLIILADVFKSDIAHGKPPCVKTKQKNVFTFRKESIGPRKNKFPICFYYTAARHACQYRAREKAADPCEQMWQKSGMKTASSSVCIEKEENGRTWPWNGNSLHCFLLCF